MKNLFIKLFALLGLATSTFAAEVIIKEGDCWSYEARPGEENSYLVIRKIETLPKVGEVIHISIFGVKIKSPTAPNGYTDEVGHLPIAGADLRTSLKQKVDKKIPKADWKEGYKIWREAFDAQKAGVFAQPVNKCIDFVEAATTRGKTQ